MLHLSRRGFLYWDDNRASAMRLLAGLFDATRDRVAQDLASLFGSGSRSEMNTISGDKAQLPGGGQSAALPVVTPEGVY
jgi:hypothetical protein